MLRLIVLAMIVLALAIGVYRRNTGRDCRPDQIGVHYPDRTMCVDMVWPNQRG